MNIKVAPSLLSADFGRLAAEIEMVEEAGADILHLDIMDAHFVPNLTFGPIIVKAIKNLTRLPIDVHLMITDPDKYLDDFIESGADLIDFHLEAFETSTRHKRACAILDRLDKSEIKSGIAINPDTPADWAYPYLTRLDGVLIMTVYPGFGGQKLMEECLGKILPLKEEAAGKGMRLTAGVDGGVNLETAAGVVEAGADVLIAGSAVFHAPDPPEVIRRLKSTASCD